VIRTPSTPEGPHTTKLLDSARVTADELVSGSRLMPSRVGWCYGVVDQFGDQSAGRVLKLPLRMRMKKAGQQIAAVLGSAGRRREAPGSASAGRGGLRLVGRREGSATRVGGSCGPRRGLADAIDTGSKGDISDAYRCDTPNVV